MAASTPKPAWVDALFAALPGTILLPGSQDFEDSDSRYYTAANTEIKSAAVARPTSTADVSKLITVLRRDVPDHVPIAIHGAGHATARGAAKAEGGVTIDTRGLKGVEILPGNRSVRISAGETWRDVFRVLEAHRPPLAVAGGRMGQVGVIGYLLGGGVSHFSTAVGFAVDAVVSWEVVLASGATVTATKRENPDLWDALRGGSNNFGVVTAVELQCFDHPQSFRGGFAYYLPFARNSTLKALVEHGAAGAPGPAAPISHVMWSMTYTAGVKVINTILTTTGPANAEDMRAFTNVWGRIPMTGSLRPSTVGEFVERQSKLSPASGSRTIHKSVTVKMDLDLLMAISDLWAASVPTIRSASGVIYSLVMQSLTMGMLEASQKAASYTSTAAERLNSQGLSPDDGPLVIVALCTTWRSAEHDELVTDCVDKLLSDMRELARTRGLYHRHIFPNYAWPSEPVMAGYGEERLATLRAVAGKWDRDGFFQDRVVGGFKLNKTD